jgi:solute carrier family 24 (sodium/potassium/calcium exchanger), member 6
MSDSSCDRSHIYALPKADRCGFVQDNCSGNVNVFNLTEFYFCTMAENYFLMIILGVILITLCFRVIGSISDEFLSISLGNISKRLGLSEALTGVTLLAYANGAPDIISSMVAGGEDGGALLSIGALYGASLFTCNFVYASVLHNSPDKEAVQLNKFLFLRDIGTFFIATTLLIFLGFLNISTISVSLILFSIYASYVAYVGYEEWQQKRQNPELVKFNSLPSNEDIESVSPTKENQVRLVDENGTSEDADRDPKRHMGGRGLARFFKQQKHKVLEKCGEGNWIDKAFFVIEYPLELLMSITIPPGDKEEYSCWIATFYPFTCVYAYFISTLQTLLPDLTIGSMTLPIILWILPIQILLSILIFKFTKNQDPKLPTVMMFCSAVMSVVWIYIVANIVMDILNLIQAVSGFSKVFLGLTLLSLGNSLGDFFVDTALAKKGFTTMAFTGIFSGQLLNLLIGFSLNCLMSYLSNKKNNTDTTFHLFDTGLFSQSKQFLCFFVMAYSSMRLLSYIFIGITSGYKFAKCHKFIGLGVYTVFVMSFVFFEFVIFRNQQNEDS